MDPPMAERLSNKTLSISFSESLREEGRRKVFSKIGTIAPERSISDWLLANY